MTTRKLYMNPVSLPCQAVLMTARHIGVDLDNIPLKLRAEDTNTSEFLKMNPLGTVPTLDDDGFIVWESHAIMTYLVSKYAPNCDLYPADPQERAIVDRMLYFDSATVYQTLADTMYGPIFRVERQDPEKLQTLKDVLNILDGCLQNSSHVAGNHLTLADLCILAHISLLEVSGYDVKQHERIHRWFQKLKELPYYEELCLIPLVRCKKSLDEIHEVVEKRRSREIRKDL